MSDNKISRHSLFGTLILAMLLSLSCNHDLSNGHHYGRLYLIEEADRSAGWIDSVGNIVVPADGRFFTGTHFVDGAGMLWERKGKCRMYNSHLENVWSADNATTYTTFHEGYNFVTLNPEGDLPLIQVLLDRDGNEIFRREEPFGIDFTVEDGLVFQFSRFPRGVPVDFRGKAILPNGYRLRACGYAVASEPARERIFIREGLMAMQRADPEDGHGTGDYFFADTKGVFKPYQFPKCGCFSNGLAPAMDSTTARYGYIDHDGKWQIAPQFQEARDFSEGLAAVQAYQKDGLGKWGFIDGQGTWVIAPQFVRAWDFHDRRAYVWSAPDSIGGFVDPTGKLAFGLVDGFYSWVSMNEFHHGLAMVSTGDMNFAVVDTLGNQICALPEDTFLDAWWDAYLIQVGNGWMNHKGEWVWQPKSGE